MNGDNPTEFSDLASITLIQEADETWAVFVSPRAPGEGFRMSGFADAFAAIEAVAKWLERNAPETGQESLPFGDAAGGIKDSPVPTPARSPAVRPSSPKPKRAARRSAGK